MKILQCLKVYLWYYIPFLIVLAPQTVSSQIYQEHAFPALTPVGHSATAWADYNNDGYLDLLVSGQQNNGDYSTALYKNNGDGSFTLYSTFTPVANGSVIWGDVNQDTYLDFHLTGQTSSGTLVSQLYINQGNETFALHPAALEGVSYSAAAFADFDHDGDLDLVYTGIDDHSKSVFKCYKNESNTFSEVNMALPGFSHGSLETSDFNHDGYLDLLVAGLLEDGSKTTRIYRNEHNFTFTQLNTTLAPIAFGQAAWGDYNQDGYPDILLSGIGEGGVPVSKIYRNNQNAVFTEVAAGLKPLTNSSVRWLDYNNDGALDIFITGLEGSNAENMLYENNQDESFSLVSNTGILKVYDGHVSLTDHDLNGSLDLLVTGFNNMGVQSALYTNTLNLSNTKPSVPAGLMAVAQDDSVVLQWQAASDVETSSEGLSYNMYMGTSPDQADVISPAAFTADGRRKILKPGSQQYVTSYTVKNLPEGRYYWAVQAIDASLQASAFVPADSFTVCHAVHLGADTAICPGETVGFTLGKEGDQVDWYSVKGIYIENQQSIQLSFYETDTVWAVLKNTLGCVFQDTIVVAVHPLPAVYVGNDTTVCYQEHITLTAGLPGDRVNWYAAGRGLLASDTTLLHYQALASDTLWAEVFNPYGCVSYDSLVVEVHALPETEAGEDRFLCFGSTTILGSIADENLQYQWSPVYALDNPYVANPVASPDTTTTYVLQVTNLSGCVYFDTVTVTVNPPPVLDAGEDTAICKGESIVLGGMPTASGSQLAYTYEWFPQTSLGNPWIPNPMATPDSTTTYTLIVHTGDCRTDTAHVTIEVHALPKVSVNPDMTIGFGETVSLEASGGTQYHWFPSAGLSRDDIANPSAAPEVTTTYVVTATNAQGCSSQDSVTLYVHNRVFIPNLFSPNQDGHNDTFKVYGSGIETLLLQVYDLQGKRMYSAGSAAEAMERGWDGTFRGMPLPSGAYLWTIEGRFYDGKPVTFEGKTSGRIRLIR